MPRKRHKPEEIVAKLRQVDVMTAQGKSRDGVLILDQQALGFVPMPWNDAKICALERCQNLQVCGWKAYKNASSRGRSQELPR